MVKVNGNQIECEYVVLATGMWSRQIEKIGVSVPLYPADIFMLLQTDRKSLQDTSGNRDFDNSVYFKEDAVTLIGIFEGNHSAFDKTNEVQKTFLLENSQKILNILNHLEKSMKRFPI